LLVATASPGGSAHVIALSQLKQARSARDTAASRLGYATIVAPRDGVLISRSVEQGTVVQPGKALMVLAPAGATQIVLLVDERNLGKLALGQKAVASADAYADQRFGAVLSYINPAVDIARASVEVKLTVAEPPAYLRQDMTVSVDIEIARAADAISLPARSVHDLLSGAPWVLAIRGGRAEKVAVQVGIQGTTRIEIRKGLEPGEVATPATADVAAGQRARALPK
jgi:HlyD family secretion protein